MFHLKKFSARPMTMYLACYQENNIMLPLDYSKYKSRLAFNPQFFQVCFQGYGFQSNTRQGQEEHAKEEHGATFGLYNAAKVEQMSLQPSTKTQ